MHRCRQDLSAARRKPTGFWTRVLSSAEQLWPRLQDVFNLRYKEVVEPLIQQSKPRWVYETRVLDFEIGDVPPTITGVKAFKESSSPNHVSSLLRRLPAIAAAALTCLHAGSTTQGAASLLRRAVRGLANASSPAQNAQTGTMKSCSCHMDARSASPVTLLYCSAAELSRCTRSRPLSLSQLWAPAGGDGVQLPLGRYTAGQTALQTLPTLLGQVRAAWFCPRSVQPAVLQGAPLGTAKMLAAQTGLQQLTHAQRGKALYGQCYRAQLSLVQAMHRAAVSGSVHRGLAANLA